MQIFISYAHEDLSLADALEVGLSEQGHKVFFDKDDLRAGDEYHARIRAAIADMDLFIFLLSPESLAPGSYALTEMGLARERWRRPSGRVLPVIVRPVDPGQMPAYLAAVTWLQPDGDLVAETLARVAALAQRRRRRRGGWIAAAAAGAVALAAGLILNHGDRPKPPIEQDVRYKVGGSLADVTTMQPVMGATVTLRQDDAVLDTDRSDAEGRFALSYTAAQRTGRQELKLFVDDPGYVADSSDIAIDPGRTDSGDHAIQLVPISIRACRRAGAHAVIIGYFRPPSTTPQMGDLAKRIRDTLEYELMPPLQQGNATRNDPPIVVVCGTANPPSDADYPGFAKALEADAFVGGYVVAQAALSTVVMKIADRFDVLRPLAEAESAPVDLDDPRAARLGADAHRPILIALATGYEHAGRPAECVEVTTAAQTILGVLPPELAAARQRCQAGLPNRGLLEHAP